MAIEERLPPACAFAISVLQERELDPDAVPEEAVEAAQQHLTTCIRCLSSPPMIASPRKKKKARRPVESDYVPAYEQSEEPVSQPLLQADAPRVTITLEEATQPASQPAALSRPAPAPRPAATPKPAAPAANQAVATAPKPAPQLPAPPAAEPNVPALLEGLIIDCAQCRELLPEYAEALDSGQNMGETYPEVYYHLLTCDTGCLVLLDLFRQDAKANRKFRRRPVRDPFSAIGWEISGFFRTGQVPMKPMALAYGTLILMLLIASLSVFLAVKWDDARYYHPPVILHTIPTPDGIGLSDGLHIYDACNAASYEDKRAAAQAMQQNQLKKATTLLAQGITATSTDTTGCNGAESAIYGADLQVRQSGRAFGILLIGFDSGPGNADPTGGTDRHNLYAAYTQELIGAYIAQDQYNSSQMKTPGAPLLYLVLANDAGQEQGALQIANAIANLASAPNLSGFGLLAQGKAPLLGVVGMAPSSLLQVALPILCHAGIPIISPTATGLFIIQQLVNTSMYQHCAPGFAFARFSVDDAGQSKTASNYAYTQLMARKVAVFYDPSNPSSDGSAQAFLSDFSGKADTHIVAQETAVSNGLLDSDGQQQADTSVLLAGLNDALQAKPDLVFAPMLTNDVLILAQAIAKLPAGQQPALIIGGEFVHPAALQGLVQWARQQKLTLPHIYVSVSAAARQGNSTDDWQKAFYDSACQSFATPGSFCSGAAVLDQGALLFADSVEMVARALGPLNAQDSLPTSAQLVQKLSTENFAGVSCQVNVILADNILIISKGVPPVILGIEGDGSLQIVG